MLKVFIALLITTLSVPALAQTNAKEAFDKARSELSQKQTTKKRTDEKQLIEETRAEVLREFSDNNYINLPQIQWQQLEDVSDQYTCVGCKLLVYQQNGYVINSSLEPCKITIVRQHTYYEKKYRANRTIDYVGRPTLTINIDGVCIGASGERQLHQATNRPVYFDE